MEKANRACSVAKGVVNLFPAQKRPHNAQVLAEGLDAHGLHAHDAHGRMPGAEAEEDATRRNLIDRGNGMGRNRSDAAAGNRDSAANMNPRGMLRGQRQGGIAVRPDHLGVRDPGPIIAQVLGVFHQLPVIDAGGKDNAKLHASSCVRFRRVPFRLKPLA